MAAPSYTEDLTDIATGDEASGWVELTGTDGGGKTYSIQGAPAFQDGDYPFIQGQYSVTQDCSKDASVGSLAYPVSAITIPTDGAVFVWQNYMVASNIYNYATGGFRICIGSGLNDFDVFYTGGVDKSPYPYGGWDCQVANDTVTPDDTAGTPTGTINYVGGAVYVTVGSQKGEVHNVDVMRYGRGSSIFEFGDVGNGYCTFAGYAAVNDNNTNRWGLIQETAGGYLWQGRMLLGSTAGNLVDFRDSNRNIFVKWTPKVTENFNLIEIQNSSSFVSMTGMTFQVLDTSTASRGKFLVTDPADVYLEQCTFIDMDTFTFHTTSTSADVIDCTFRRCELITQNDAVFEGCTFDSSTASAGLLASDLDVISTCAFISDGTGHAMELSPATSGGTYTLTGCTFTDYAAVSGSTGNEAIYNNSGGHVVISVGTGQIPSYRNGVGSTTVIQGSVSVLVDVNDTNGVAVSGAQTAIYLTSDRTELVNVDTDVNGQVIYSYAGSTPVGVEVRVRKASSINNPKYKNYSSIQTIQSITGLTLSVTLIVDPNNNATT